MNEKNIIIIDTDNETTLKIKSVLESEEYIIHNTSGKTESLSLAKKLIPSLIFINIAMRDVSGLEIAKAIHDTDTLSRIPIVIITPHGGTVEPRYTEMYGIVDFLKRSFTPEELISKVIDITETRSGAEKAYEKEIPDSSDKKPIELREETAEIEIPIETTAYSKDTKFQSVLEEEKEMVVEELVKQDEVFIHDIQISESIESQTKISSSEEKLLEAEPSKEDNETDIDISYEPTTDNILEEPIDKKKSETKSIALIAVAITVFILIAGTGIYFFSNFSKKSVETPPIKPPVQEKGIATSKIQEQEKTTTQPETITDTSKIKPTIENQQGHPKEPVPVKAPQKTIESADKQKIIPKTPAHSEKKKVKQFYSVQFGVFKSEKFAKSFAKELSKNNYNVFIEKTTGKNNSVLYRVLSRKYKNKKEAEKYSKEILTKNKIQTVIYKITEK